MMVKVISEERKFLPDLLRSRLPFQPGCSACAETINGADLYHSDQRHFRIYGRWSHVNAEVLKNVFGCGDLHFSFNLLAAFSDMVALSEIRVHWIKAETILQVRHAENVTALRTHYLQRTLPENYAFFFYSDQICRT